MSGIATTIVQPASLQLTINPPAQTTTVLQVGQGPAGPEGEKGLPGEGIDNYPSDPLAFYILAKS